MASLVYCPPHAASSAPAGLLTRLYTILQVTTCATGREALSFLRAQSQTPPDLVLKDSEPGTCDAARLLRRMKQGGLGQVPVVGERGGHAGAADFTPQSQIHISGRAACTSPCMHPPTELLRGTQTMQWCQARIAGRRLSVP